MKNKNKVKCKEVGPDKCPVDLIIMQMKSGSPNKPGWYFVELEPGHTAGDKKYDVDYCKQSSPSDGGEWVWCKWYSHNISRYAELPA